MPVAPPEARKGLEVQIHQHEQAAKMAYAGAKRLAAELAEVEAELAAAKEGDAE